MNKIIFWSVISFIGGAVSGTFAAARILREKISAECQAEAEKDIRDAREYYKMKAGITGETGCNTSNSGEMDEKQRKINEIADIIANLTIEGAPEEEIEAAVKRSMEIIKPKISATDVEASFSKTPLKGNYIDYTSFAKDNSKVVMPEEARKVEENDEDELDGWPETAINEPYLIHKDTYYGQNPDSKSSHEWNFVNFVYYADDDIVADDEDDDIIKNWKKVLGKEWKDHFGDQDYDCEENEVFVRSPRFKSDIYIQFERSAYKYSVLDYDESDGGEQYLKGLYKSREKDYREDNR